MKNLLVLLMAMFCSYDAYLFRSLPLLPSRGIKFLVSNSEKVASHSDFTRRLRTERKFKIWSTKLQTSNFEAPTITPLLPTPQSLTFGDHIELLSAKLKPQMPLNELLNVFEQMKQLMWRHQFKSIPLKNLQEIQELIVKRFTYDKNLSSHELLQIMSHLGPLGFCAINENDQPFLHSLVNRYMKMFTLQKSNNEINFNEITLFFHNLQQLSFHWGKLSATKETNLANQFFITNFPQFLSDVLNLLLSSMTVTSTTIKSDDNKDHKMFPKITSKQFQILLFSLGELEIPWNIMNEEERTSLLIKLNEFRDEYHHYLDWTVILSSLGKLKGISSLKESFSYLFGLMKKKLTANFIQMKFDAENDPIKFGPVLSSLALGMGQTGFQKQDFSDQEIHSFIEAIELCFSEMNADEKASTLIGLAKMNIRWPQLTPSLKEQIATLSKQELDEEFNCNIIDLYKLATLIGSVETENTEFKKLMDDLLKYISLIANQRDSNGLKFMKGLVEVTRLLHDYHKIGSSLSKSYKQELISLIEKHYSILMDDLHLPIKGQEIITNFRNLANSGLKTEIRVISNVMNRYLIDQKLKTKKFHDLLYFLTGFVKLELSWTTFLSKEIKQQLLFIFNSLTNLVFPSPASPTAFHPPPLSYFLQDRNEDDEDDDDDDNDNDDDNGMNDQDNEETDKGGQLNENEKKQKRNMKSNEDALKELNHEDLLEEHEQEEGKEIKSKTKKSTTTSSSSSSKNAQYSLESRHPVMKEMMTGREFQEFFSDISLLGIPWTDLSDSFQKFLLVNIGALRNAEKPIDWIGSRIIFNAFGRFQGEFDLNQEIKRLGLEEAQTRMTLFLLAMDSLQLTTIKDTDRGKHIGQIFFGMGRLGFKKTEIPTKAIGIMINLLEDAWDMMTKEERILSLHGLSKMEFSFQDLTIFLQTKFQTFLRWDFEAINQQYFYEPIHGQQSIYKEFIESSTAPLPTMNDSSSSSSAAPTSGEPRRILNLNNIQTPNSVLQSLEERMKLHRYSVNPIQIEPARRKQINATSIHTISGAKETFQYFFQFKQSSTIMSLPLIPANFKEIILSFQLLTGLQYPFQRNAGMIHSINQVLFKVFHYAQPIYYQLNQQSKSNSNSNPNQSGFYEDILKDYNQILIEFFHAYGKSNRNFPSGQDPWNELHPMIRDSVLIPAIERGIEFMSLKELSSLVESLGEMKCHWKYLPSSLQGKIVKKLESFREQQRQEEQAEDEEQKAEGEGEAEAEEEGEDEEAIEEVREEDSDPRQQQLLREYLKQEKKRKKFYRNRDYLDRLEQFSNLFSGLGKLGFSSYDHKELMISLLSDCFHHFDMKSIPILKQEKELIQSSDAVTKMIIGLSRIQMNWKELPIPFRSFLQHFFITRSPSFTNEAFADFVYGITVLLFDQQDLFTNPPPSSSPSSSSSDVFYNTSSLPAFLLALFQESHRRMTLVYPPSPEEYVDESLPPPPPISGFLELSQTGRQHYLIWQEFFFHLLPASYRRSIITASNIKPTLPSPSKKDKLKESQSKQQQQQHHESPIILLDPHEKEDERWKPLPIKKLKNPKDIPPLFDYVPSPSLLTVFSEQLENYLELTIHPRDPTPEPIPEPSIPLSELPIDHYDKKLYGPWLAPNLISVPDLAAIDPNYPKKLDGILFTPDNPIFKSISIEPCWKGIHDLDFYSIDFLLRRNSDQKVLAFIEVDSKRSYFPRSIKQNITTVDEDSSSSINEKEQQHRQRQLVEVISRDDQLKRKFYAHFYERSLGKEGNPNNIPFIRIREEDLLAHSRDLTPITQLIASFLEKF